MTTLRIGSATDVGQVRKGNEDSLLVVAANELYGVADGMGGHQGGEVASAMAVDIAGERATDPDLETLKSAVREANRAIFEKAGGDRDLHGMGTTFVAVQLVEGPDGDEIAWVNVGDSRLYLLRDDRLIQLSDDHSLVEDLVRDGQLTHDEAATHPRRNIVTRALGIDLDVDVDGNTVQPFTGDRYLLCSDGLSDEVTSDQMASVLRRLADPDEASAELVRLANEGGGRDNITVLIVDVVDDGGRSAAASAAMADDPTTVLSAGPVAAAPVAAHLDETTAVAIPSDPDQMTASAIPSGRPAGPGQPGQVLTGQRSSLPEAGDTYAARGDDVFGDLGRARTKRITWRVFAFLLLLLVVAGVVVGAIGWSASRTYFVGFAGDEVAVYQGKPGGVLWFDPKQVDTTPFTRSDVPPALRPDLVAGKEFGSRSDAARYLRNLREQIADDAPTSTTTAPSTTTTAAVPTTPVTTVPGAPAPAPPATPAPGP